jgi:hypothetical protein
MIISLVIIFLVGLITVTYVIEMNPSPAIIHCDTVEYPFGCQDQYGTVKSCCSSENECNQTTGNCEV